MRSSKFLNIPPLHFECITIILGIPSAVQTFQIVSLYRSPSCSVQEFKQHILLDLVPQIDQQWPVVLTGGFNFNLQNDQHVSIINFLENILHCKQYIYQPTTVKNSTLDLVFTDCKVLQSQVLYCAWSDHNTVQTIIKINQ